MADGPRSPGHSLADRLVQELSEERERSARQRRQLCKMLDEKEAEIIRLKMEMAHAAKEARRKEQLQKKVDSQPSRATAILSSLSDVMGYAENQAEEQSYNDKAAPETSAMDAQRALQIAASKLEAEQRRGRSETLRLRESVSRLANAVYQT